MATAISNPASFSSVRTAFNAEGYGTSTSFFAYRQGGSIVPATTPFNGIGAGTIGDPLQLSQFNGFIVPSPYLDLQTITIGYTLVFAGDFSYVYAYHGYSNGLTGGEPIGGITDGTSNLYGGAAIYSIYSFDSDPNNAGNVINVYFEVQGSRANAGWTNINIGSNIGPLSYSRSSAYYTNNGSYTQWRWANDDQDPIPFGVETTEVTWN